MFLFVFHLYLSCFLGSQKGERTLAELVPNQLTINFILKDEFPLKTTGNVPRFS